MPKKSVGTAYFLWALGGLGVLGFQSPRWCAITTIRNRGSTSRTSPLTSTRTLTRKRKEPDSICSGMHQRPLERSRIPQPEHRTVFIPVARARYRWQESDELRRTAHRG